MNAIRRGETRDAFAQFYQKIYVLHTISYHASSYGSVTDSEDEELHGKENVFA